LKETALMQDRVWFIEYSVAITFNVKAMQLCWGQYENVDCLK